MMIRNAILTVLFAMNITAVYATQPVSSPVDADDSALSEQEIAEAVKVSDSVKFWYVVPDHANDRAKADIIKRFRADRLSLEAARKQMMDIVAQEGHVAKFERGQGAALDDVVGHIGEIREDEVLSHFNKLMMFDVYDSAVNLSVANMYLGVETDFRAVMKGLPVFNTATIFKDRYYDADVRPIEINRDEVSAVRAAAIIKDQAQANAEAAAAAFPYASNPDALPPPTSSGSGESANPAPSASAAPAARKGQNHVSVAE